MAIATLIATGSFSHACGVTDFEHGGGYHSRDRGNVHEKIERYNDAGYGEVAGEPPEIVQLDVGRHIACELRVKT